MKDNITRAEPNVEKFWLRLSPVSHFVKLNTSTNKIPKNRKRMSHRERRLVMIGKLALRARVRLIHQIDEGLLTPRS
jgi:hypothetical protein